MKTALRFYLFLRDRDSKVTEGFFLSLNLYILALTILPPHSYTGTGLAIRIAFQLLVVIINIIALVKTIKVIRIISALTNTMIMSFIAFALIIRNNPNSGTYGLLAVLALFICWKIVVRPNTQ